MSFTGEFSNSEMNLLLAAVGFYEDDLRAQCPSILELGRREWAEVEEVQRYRQASALLEHLRRICVEGEDPRDAGRLEGYARAEVYRLLEKQAV